MSMDAPRFVPDLGIDKNPSRFKRAVSALKSRLGISQYEEVFGDMVYRGEDGIDYPFPTKAVIKDGILVAKPHTYSIYSSPSFVTPSEVPSFAVGRCIDLSNGDNKVVMIDHDGQSDQVIKRYQRHTYFGEGAQERAMLASYKLDAMYAVMADICPQFLLPIERFVHPMPYRQNDQEGWAVFEKQQRALFVSPWLVEEPKLADEIASSSQPLSSKYHKKISAALIRAGICQRESQSKGVAWEELGFGLSYDARTRSLREDDIIDYVHLPKK